LLVAVDCLAVCSSLVLILAMPSMSRRLLLAGSAAPPRSACGVFSVTPRRATHLLKRPTLLRVYAMNYPEYAGALSAWRDLQNICTNCAFWVICISLFQARHLRGIEGRFVDYVTVGKFIGGVWRLVEWLLLHIATGCLLGYCVVRLNREDGGMICRR